MSLRGARSGGEERCGERVSSSEKAGLILGLTIGPQGCLLCGWLCLSNITAQRHWYATWFRLALPFAEGEWRRVLLSLSLLFPHSLSVSPAFFFPIQTVRQLEGSTILPVPLPYLPWASAHQDPDKKKKEKKHSKTPPNPLKCFFFGQQSLSLISFNTSLLTCRRKGSLVGERKGSWTDKLCNLTVLSLTPLQNILFPYHLFLQRKDNYKLAVNSFI